MRSMRMVSAMGIVTAMPGGIEFFSLGIGAKTKIERGVFWGLLHVLIMDRKSINRLNSQHSNDAQGKRSYLID